MNHQDWNTVALKTHQTKRTTAATSFRSQADADAARLENDEPVKRDTNRIKHFVTDLKNARLSRKMTQKELATFLNMKPDIVQSIENGKLVPDSSIIQKIKRKLNV
jgi:putative transcription factor